MARFGHRVWSFFDLGVRHHVTRAGLFFTTACAGVAMAAFASANNLLFLILAAMLATLMISGLVSRLSLAGLELDLILPEHIAAGRRVTGRIVVRNLKRWMASFSIHVAGQGSTGLDVPEYFPVIPGGSSVEQPVECLFAHRGSYRENNFRFATRFPFGFSERRVNVLLRREIIVYPRVDPQPGFEDLLASLAGEMESWFRGHGHDFYRIRPYEALESARHVDWKATAHTGALQVREFARERDQELALFLDLDVDAAREWFERAVDCCAYLAWSMTQRGARVSFYSQDAALRVPDETDVYTILKYLAVVSREPVRSLPVIHDRNAFHVLFSASGSRLQESGWDIEAPNVRVFGANDPLLRDKRRRADAAR